MKTRFLKIPVFFLALAVCFGCKDNVSSAEAVADIGETVPQMTSEAAVQDAKSPRKFIRSANARFEVRDVGQATYAIENAAAKFGGFVTHTQLQSHILETRQTQISPDSTLQSVRFKVDNSLTLRVPNVHLDTVLRTIGKQVEFLDYRTIKADDVSLQLQASRLASKRSASSEKRLEKAIDAKAAKLKSVLEAEDRLDAKKMGNDASVLQALQWKDQVDFSTVTIEIYQKETIHNSVVANTASLDAYRPHFGWRILDGLKTGWYFLENIIAFVARLWSVALLIFIGMFLYRHFSRPKLKL